MSGCLRDGTAGCCGVKSPAPYPPLQTSPAPASGLSAKRREGFEYYGEFLKHCDFPLGGFAGGQVILKGDGTLQDWTVVNRVRKEAQPMDIMPANFFGIQVDNEPPMLLADSKVMESAQEPTEGLSVESIRARYPVADVKFGKGGDFPLTVSMRAMTPLIPQDVKHSSLPAAIFQVTVENPVTPNKCDNPHTVRVMFSQQNFVGWDGEASCKNSAAKKSFWGGNQNNPFVIHGDGSALAGLEFTRANIDPHDAFSGTASIAALAVDHLHSVTVITDAQSEAQLWQSFSEAKDLQVTDARESSPSPPGFSSCGGVIQRATLAPGESRTFEFALTWHFPNRSRSDSVGPLYANILPGRLGNRYAVWFKDAIDTASYINHHLDHLVTKTLDFVELLYSSTLPADIINSSAAALAIFRSPTMFYSEDGIVLGTEGNGCCPVNCTHVYGYTTLIEKLFPSLALDMRRSDFVRNYNGGVLMRFGRGGWAIDGALACVIKTYLLVQQFPESGIGWLKDIYPNVKDQMQRILSRFDSKGDGVITDAQQNTYDAAMYGANTFIGSYYVTALRSTAAMAELVGDSAWSKALNARADRSSANYEKMCWREDFQYYIGIVPKEKCRNSYNFGCFVDQLCAIGLSAATGFGHIFNPLHEAAARKSILQHNKVTKPPWNDLQKHLFDGDTALTVATYPNGKLCRMRYDTLCSTGFSSPVVAGMLLDRNIEDALEIVSFIRQRHDG